MEIFHFTILLALTATAVLGRKSHYDHQTETYTSQHKGTGCRKAMNVTSYFSPDHSIEMYVSLINSATESIDIFTPGNLVFTKAPTTVQNYSMHVCSNILAFWSHAVQCTLQS